MDKMRTAECIKSGHAVLGIEFGSTRIKAVLIDESYRTIASGSHDWENHYVNNIWTYTMDDVCAGLRACYADLKREVKEKYDLTLTTFGAIGFSGMMHGYLPFDEKGNQLAEFRTWRNTITEPASEKLSEVFRFHIPQRWSVAHLYQAVLNGEEHVKDVHFITTLSGYIHWKMTGRKVLGIGDAAGMFPIDSVKNTWNAEMLIQFDELMADKGFTWKIEEILPEVLTAGQNAGILTEEGAKLLDADGDLQPGIPMCPPEGDAGTGMVATNSVAVRTGNVSAGTSVFAMAVLEQPLSKPYEEIDMVTTPAGDPVAMVHCNNCTSDLNAWVGLFRECLEVFGTKVDMNTLFETLYNKALEGEADCGGLLAYNYFSGEHITGFEEGRPLFVRRPDSRFNLANFMRVHLCTSLGALKTGMDILTKQEKVELDKMLGHGGLFKTKGVGQQMLAAAIDTPVYVMETAGEGGAWGIALLASYMRNREDHESLTEYLAEKVFGKEKGERMEPVALDVAGFEKFMESYTAGLVIERAAVDSI